MMLIETIGRHIQEHYAAANRLKHRWHSFMEQCKKANAYPFILEGYYFCDKKQSITVIIRMRHKRLTLEMSVLDIVANKHLIHELSPIDACIIGILMHHQCNVTMSSACNDWRKMRSLKNNHSFPKIDPLLQITKTYLDPDGDEKVGLYAATINQEMEIATMKLLKNRDMLYALDPLEALSIGYSASESLLRKEVNMGH